jgi:superfamily II RNA helicase
MLRQVDLSKQPEHSVTDYAIKYKFPLDIFQEHAISAIDQGHNVLVCAKTGSGKTLVGEYQIAHSLRKGQRVFYTTPIKSLSNQKFHDLKQMWPGRVGIMTGDIKFCPTADIIVMTTEILRNLLYKQGTTTEALGLTASLSLSNLGAVIFDECHYINDRDRGKIWEETMILLPPTTNLVLLSATLDKPEIFAGWLGELKQVPCHVIQTMYRVVPLTHYVIQDGWLKTIMDEKEIFNDSAYNDWLRNRQMTEKEHDAFQRKVVAAKAGGHIGPITGKVKPVSFQHQLSSCIKMLNDKTLLPALAFVLSRKGCEQFAAKTEADLLDSSDVAAALHIFDFHLRHHKANLENLPQYHSLRRLLQKGVAFHHSGVLPVLKEIIEILFTKGYIKLLYCTETFAVGINMPTKTVIFTGLSKYDDATGGMRLLRTDEYIQMAGRAGRRGKDPLGTVIYLPDREPPSVAEMRSMLKGGKPQVQSRMDFHYDFLLKTLQSQNLKWLDILESSYWNKQHKQAIDAEERNVESLKKKIETLNVDESLIKELAERDEILDQIKNTNNAKQKAAKRLLERWNDSHLGPKWVNGQRSYEIMKVTQKEYEHSLKTLDSMKSFHGNAETWLHILEQSGFIEGTSLTKKGILATECNEGHTILTAEFYSRGLHKDLSGPELIAALACLIEEKETELTPSLESMNVSDGMKNVLYNLDKITKDILRLEGAAGIYSRESYWVLSTTWIEPMWRWLNGEHASVICSDYGLFEGNFVRAVLRIANMADEWTAMATFSEDIELLEKLKDVRGSLVRDIIIPDSLYLHI